jgi:hypothetical protein
VVNVLVLPIVLFGFLAPLLGAALVLLAATRPVPQRVVRRRCDE